MPINYYRSHIVQFREAGGRGWHETGHAPQTRQGAMRLAADLENNQKYLSGRLKAEYRVKAIEAQHAQ